MFVLELDHFNEEYFSILIIDRDYPQFNIILVFGTGFQGTWLILPISLAAYSIRTSGYVGNQLPRIAS